MIYDGHVLLEAAVVSRPDDPASLPATKGVNPQDASFQLVDMGYRQIYTFGFQSKTQSDEWRTRLEVRISLYLDQEKELHKLTLLTSDGGWIPSSGSGGSGVRHRPGDDGGDKDASVQLLRKLLVSERRFHKKALHPLMEHYYSYLSQHAVLEKSELAELFHNLPELAKLHDTVVQLLPSEEEVPSLSRAALLDAVLPLVEAMVPAAGAADDEATADTADAAGGTAPAWDVERLPDVARTLVALMAVPNRSSIQFVRSKLDELLVASGNELGDQWSAFDADMRARCDKFEQCLQKQQHANQQAGAAAIQGLRARDGLVAVLSRYATSLPDRLAFFDRLLQSSATFRAFIESREDPDAADDDNDDCDGAGDAGAGSTVVGSSNVYQPLRQLLRLPAERFPVYRSSLRAWAGSVSTDEHPALRQALDQCLPLLAAAVHEAVDVPRTRQRRSSVAWAGSWKQFVQQNPGLQAPSEGLLAEAEAAAPVDETGRPTAAGARDGGHEQQQPEKEEVSARDRMRARVAELNRELEAPAVGKADFMRKEQLKRELQALEEELLVLRTPRVASALPRAASDESRESWRVKTRPTPAEPPPAAPTVVPGAPPHPNSLANDGTGAGGSKEPGTAPPSLVDMVKRRGGGGNSLRTMSLDGSRMGRTGGGPGPAAAVASLDLSLLGARHFVVSRSSGGHRSTGGSARTSPRKLRRRSNSDLPPAGAAAAAVDGGGTSAAVMGGDRRSKDLASSSGARQPLSSATVAAQPGRRSVGSAIVRRPSRSDDGPPGAGDSSSGLPPAAAGLLDGLPEEVLRLWELHQKRQHLVVKEQLRTLAKPMRQQFRELVEAEKTAKLVRKSAVAAAASAAAASPGGRASGVTPPKPLGHRDSLRRLERRASHGSLLSSSASSAAAPSLSPLPGSARLSGSSDRRRSAEHSSESSGTGTGAADLRSRNELLEENRQLHATILELRLQIAELQSQMNK